jgi:hypothetical protein
MEKILICSSICVLLSLAFVGGGNTGKSVKLVANKEVAEPTLGNLQTAIDDAAKSTYTKTSDITSYTGTSNYPYSAHNPLTTEYTQTGLYMVERGSGYYTYNNAIWHVKKDGDNWVKSLSMSEYNTFDAYYVTLKSFGGTYASTRLETDSSDTSGLSFKNVSASYSSPDIRKMIFFVAPLVTLDDDATFSNYSFEFKMNKDSNYVLDSISISLDITQNSTTSSLTSTAFFTKIGSTELDYII